MNIGELFVKLKLGEDKQNNASVGKFKAGLGALKDKAMDFRKQAQLIAREKLPQFFRESEFGSVGFLGKLTDMIGKANLVRVAILGVVASMVKLTSRAAEASEQLFKFGLNSGMSTTALQKLQMQAEQTGVEADEVADSLRELQSKSMDIQLGRGDAGAFQLAGVSWFADAETQLNQIEQMLKTRPAAMGTKLAMDMGLSEEMITFLRLRASIKPADQGLILSPEEIGELKEFSIEFKATWAAFQRALTKLGAMILPITKPFMEFARRLARIGTEIIGWMTAIESRKTIILSIIGVIGTALAAAFFPATVTILGIVAALGAVLLVIDDIATFLRGGDSVTGRVWSTLSKNFTTEVELIKGAWKVFVDWIIGTGKMIGEGLFSSFKLIYDLFTNPEKVLEDAKLTVKGVGESVMEKGADLGSAIKGFFGFNQPAMVPAVAPTPAMAGAVSTMNQNVQINVNGAGDPKAVSEEVSRRLRQETSNAVYQMPRQEQ